MEPRCITYCIYYIYYILTTGKFYHDFRFPLSNLRTLPLISSDPPTTVALQYQWSREKDVILTHISLGIIFMSIFSRQEHQIDVLRYPSTSEILKFQPKPPLIMHCYLYMKGSLEIPRTVPLRFKYSRWPGAS